jgi:hypothetical protein
MPKKSYACLKAIGLPVQTIMVEFDASSRLYSEHLQFFPPSQPEVLSAVQQ